MNGKQEIKLTMEMAVRDELNINSTITATIPGFATYFTPFVANITQIQNISEQQGFSKKGISGNKKQLRTLMIVQGKDIASKVEAYAMNVNNAVLVSEIHFTESDLTKLAATELRDDCQKIYDRANTNIAALATYGITAAILTAFQTAINNFNVSIPKPKLGVAERKQLTSQLTSLFAANDSLLISIDKLIETVRVSQPSFYGVYKNSRKLTDTGIHKLVLKVKVIDSSDNNPIKNVELRFVKVNAADQKTILPDVKPIVHKTATHGGVNVKHLAEGAYSVTLTKNGYKSKNIIVNITHGEMAVVEVVMEKA